MLRYTSSHGAFTKWNLRIVGILVFLGLSIYAWLTLVSTSGSRPDIFPGVLHPMEFSLVIAVAFSVLIAGYLASALIILRNGFTRSSTRQFIALTGTCALIWTLQAWGSYFVVSEGYASSDVGYRLLYLSFLLPRDILRIVDNSYVFELLPIFVVTLVMLVLAGSVLALSKSVSGFSPNALLGVAIFYLALLSFGIGDTVSTGREWIWIVSSAAVGLLSGVIAEILLRKGERTRTEQTNTHGHARLVRNSLAMGISGALGVTAWLLVRSHFPWTISKNPYIPLVQVVLVVLAAGFSGVVTAYIVLRLSKSSPAPAPTQHIQTVLPRRRVIV